MRGHGKIVGGEEWQEKVYNREDWRSLLRTARNRRILHMPKEWDRIEWSISLQAPPTSTLPSIPTTYINPTG
jgi:hypothetical protein